MVRELKVRILNLCFRHVAGGAVFVSDGATLQQPLRGGLTLQGMTLQTLFVVVCRIFFKWLMRIMTCDTANSAVVRIALTQKNSVRLKPNVVELHFLQRREFFRAAMTRSAEPLR